MTNKTDYILGLDLGATSIGWSVVRLKDGVPEKVERIGARIYSDGREAKSQEPLAVERRVARGMRRRRDRYIHRRTKLMHVLVKYGLMPEDLSERAKLKSLNPYELRKKALDEKLAPYELGRALYHINQRRGFKSNLKTDRKDSESGAMKEAIKETRKKMEACGARTLGEFLYLLNKDKKSTQDFVPVRMRSHLEKSKAVYEKYPDRAMYEDEVRQIFAKQELSDEAKKEIFDTIFFQRPLKPAELGSCEFEDGERRSYVASPAFQKFRALQQVNQLYIEDDFTRRPLEQDEKETLYHYLLDDFSALDKNGLLTWAKAKALLNTHHKLNRKIKFNLEGERRKGLNADITSWKLSSSECFGKEWSGFPDGKKEEIVSVILDAENSRDLAGKLKEKFALTDEKAAAVADTSLPDGVASLSRKAMAKIIPHLEKGLLYNEAVEKAGYTFSLRFKGVLPEEYTTFINPETGECYDELPYYGQILERYVLGGVKSEENKPFPEKYYGKINNPTVHIILNQLGKLVNALVKEYGHPKRIVVEMARDLKMSEKQKKEVAKEQAANQKDNERIGAELERLGVKNNYANRMKYKLWEDLAADVTKRCCPFCGKQISAEGVFSPEFEIEHLLPFSRTFMDARSNKVLSCRRCNREKGNRTPFEAFGADESRWNGIMGRAEFLPADKRKRFSPDAMERFKDEEQLLARMMTDTQYMARIARMYLCCAANPAQVYGIPGQLTAKLRDHWGLNSILSDQHEKDRSDHRHHAIDAFVVACTGRGTLQKYATERKDYFKPEMPDEKAPHLPFPSFRLEDIKRLFDTMVVSHKPDQGDPRGAIRNGKTVAKLHEETYYGMGGEGKKGCYLLIQRVPVSEIKTAADLDCLIDQKGTANPIRVLLELYPEKPASEVIADYFAERGTKKVRTYRERSKDVILSFKDKNGKPYRYAVYGSNAYAEIYCPDRGKNKGKWQVEVIPNYCAHQKDFVPNWRHTDAHAKLIMRLYRNDMVAYEKEGETVIARVKKMSGNGQIVFRSHLIAKEEGDTLSWRPSASSMQAANLRKIRVDVTGRVFDPQKGKVKAGGSDNQTNGSLPSDVEIKPFSEGPRVQMTFDLLSPETKAKDSDGQDH